MPFHIGPWEIALILVILLMLFGVGKLPQVGGAIGKGLRAFRKGQRGEEPQDEEAEAETSQPKRRVAKAVAEAPKPKRKTTRKVAKEDT